MRGTIRRIVPDKGFGFLAEADTGAEYFFHRSMVEGQVRFAQLQEGDLVDFTAGESQRLGNGKTGLRAERVERA